MSKPDWKSAPSWAEWLAQDISGFWNWYEIKPDKDPSCLYWLCTGEYKYAGDSERPHNIEITLERRPLASQSGTKTPQSGRTGWRRTKMDLGIFMKTNLPSEISLVNLFVKEGGSTFLIAQQA